MDPQYYTNFVQHEFRVNFWIGLAMIYIATYAYSHCVKSTLWQYSSKACFRCHPKKFTMTTFSHQLHINALPSQVFAAIEDPSRLARWWGPDGFTNTFTVFEFRKGGAWQFTMHGPDGTDYPNVSRFESIEPGQGLVIRHVCEPFFSLSITLQAHEGGTLVLWKQSFDDDSLAKAVRHIVEPANEQNLARLSEEVAFNSPSAP